MKTGTAIAPLKGVRQPVTIDPFTLLENRFNRMFEGLTPFFEEQLPLTVWTPACDVYETDKEFVICAELPGFKKEEVFVNLENNTLTIQGERKFEEEVKRENYLRVERVYGEFRRAFTIPAFLDVNKILAEFKDGLLIIRLPKREEAKPKQIEVKVK